MNPQRILVVDDEPDVLASLKLELAATAGFAAPMESESAPPPGAARDFHPRLIRLEALMPRLAGGGGSARIHADPEPRDKPVMLPTARAVNEDGGGHAVAVWLAVQLAGEARTKRLKQTRSTSWQPRRHAISVHP
jgi:CheY-like chemotaxis protein